MSAPETVFIISPSPESTIVAEISYGGNSRRKHLVFFERYSGKLIYLPDSPDASSINLEVDGNQVVCGDARAGSKKQESLTRTARAEMRGADARAQISFSSSRIVAKALRGFVAEGTLQLRGISQQIKANLVVGEQKRERIQIDADATLRMSEFGIKAPSALFGLLRPHDEVLMRILIWGTALSCAPQQE